MQKKNLLIGGIAVATGVLLYFAFTTKTEGKKDGFVRDEKHIVHYNTEVLASFGVTVTEKN